MSETTSSGRCPACDRPIAVVRPSCLYCGAALSESLLSSTRTPAETALGRGSDAPGSAQRVLLVLDLERAEVPALMAACGWTAYEARQASQRGGLVLLRVIDDRTVAAVTERYASNGVKVWRIPEAEARPSLDPLLATSGRAEGRSLRLRAGEVEIQLTAADAQLVVRGPIAREYQTSEKQRRVRTATLDPGYRYHIHHRRDHRPMELDPTAFRFAASPLSGSSLLELWSWIETVLAGVPVDDAFRLLAPAFAPAAVDAGLASALSGFGGPGVRTGSRAFASGRSQAPDQDGPFVLDNLRQFRFYSGWRAAVERRKQR